MEAEQPLSNKTFVASCAISTMSSLCWLIVIVNLEIVALVFSDSKSRNSGSCLYISKVGNILQSSMASKVIC